MKVVFACVHNAGRSQMAAALFNRLADPARDEAISAGTEPATRVHPRKLTPEVAAGADWLITMGCGEACPVIPGVKVADWALPDPRGKPIEEVRRIRDEIDRRIREFLAG